MSLLENLTTSVTDIVKKLAGEKDKVSPVALAVYVDSIAKYLHQVNAAVADPTVAKALNSLVLKGPAPTGPFHADRVSYAIMNRTLTPIFRRTSADDAAKWMSTGLGVVAQSLDELSDKVTQVIPRDGISAADPLKMSTLLTLAYLDQATMFGQWCQFMIDHALAVAESDTLTIPKYTFGYLADHAAGVALFYNNAVIHHNESVVSHILKLKGSGRDVDVSDATGLAANYLSDGNYSDWEQSTADGIIRNPISMIYTMKEHYRLNRIDTLRNRINWLKERMSLLSMRNMGVDPKSPEYKKTQTAVEYYGNLVTDYDRKIAALS